MTAKKGTHVKEGSKARPSIQRGECLETVGIENSRKLLVDPIFDSGGGSSGGGR